MDFSLSCLGKAAEKGSQGDYRAGVGKDPQRGFTLLETFFARGVQGRAGEQ